MNVLHNKIILVACVVLTACSKVPETAKPNAVPTNRPVAQTVVPVNELRLTMASPAVATAVGKKENGRLNATGRAGVLMFGPYASLKAGRYSVKVFGEVSYLPNGEFVLVDAVSEKATRKHAQMKVSGPTSGDLLAQFDVQLQSDVKEFEVRAVVPSEARVSIASYEVTAAK
jgi:ABC-type uncharacterized transport system auxiliary subunit